MTPAPRDEPPSRDSRVAELTVLVANIQAMKRAAAEEDWQRISDDLLPVVEMLAARQLARAQEQTRAT